MENFRPKTIIISGATAGLGAALALAYAEPGVVLGLLGRDSERLDRVTERCRTAGATVIPGRVDVREYDQLAAWAGRFQSQHEVDLVIVNAGVFTGNGADGSMETHSDTSWQLRINLDGAIATVNAVLPAMRSRKSGHIALVGSLAALQPLADAPAYSASKAGLMSYGEALREYLIADNIHVSLIYPGHIETEQVAHHVGALPLMVSAEKAAAIIKRGLERKRSFIAFPRRLLWLIRAGRLVPWRLRATLGKDFRFGVDKAAEDRSRR